MREKINDRRIERKIISKDNIRQFLGSLDGEEGEDDSFQPRANAISS